MAKQETLEFKGKVTELLPNAMFRDKLENNHEIVAHNSHVYKSDAADDSFSVEQEDSGRAKQKVKK